MRATGHDVGCTFQDFYTFMNKYLEVNTNELYR